MESFTINGVVLRETRYKDSDCLATVLTAERGVITLLLRGVYKVTSKNRPSCQLFCYSEFEVTTGASGYIVKTGSLKEAFNNIRNDVVKYALACYIADTASSLATAENDETEVFRLVLNTFSALSSEKPKPLWMIKSAYELKLCCLCGFTPELNGCIRCDEAETGTLEESASEGSKDAFLQGGKYIFSCVDGSLLCAECFLSSVRSGEKIFHVSMSRASLYAARFICECPTNRFISFKLSEEQAVEFSDFTEKYLLFVAERGFSTLKYYKQVAVI